MHAETLEARLQTVVRWNSIGINGTVPCRGQIEDLAVRRSVDQLLAYAGREWQMARQPGERVEIEAVGGKLAMRRHLSDSIVPVQLEIARRNMDAVTRRQGQLSGTDLETMKKSGYLTEDLVIAYAQKAGFVLEEKSEINANPADTKNHPNGVWTLPPTNRHDAKDDAKYKAIGESDRMTLRFRKP